MGGFIEIAIKLLNEWELRALILLSLSLQVTLATLGSRRKNTLKNIEARIIDLAYAAADSVAMVALAIVIRTFMDVSKYTETKIDVFTHSINAVWAMLMLLHLGGPDSITANSLVERELWLRNCLNLGVNFWMAASYALFIPGCFNFVDIQESLMAILLFIAAFVKYVEKCLALWLSSMKSSPSKKPPRAHDAVDWKKNPNENILILADFLYQILKILSAGTNLDINYGVVCHDDITGFKSAQIAFRMVKFQLGLLYDELYTNAKVIYTIIKVSIPVRCFTCLTSVYALVAFTLSRVHEGSRFVDVIITYILLCGAFVLELYGLILLFTSDWTKLWLFRSSKMNLLNTRKKMSQTITQCNLMENCLKKKATVPAASMWVGVKKWLGLDKKHELVDGALQQTIFNQLEQRIEKVDNLKDVELCKKLLNYRGDFVLDRTKCFEELKWSTIEVDFDHSLLLWHIATDLCYYEDSMKSKGGCLVDLDRYSKISRCLSGYMLYLLVKRPKMLPIHIGDIRYRDTCNHASDIFTNKHVKVKTNACHELLRPEVSSSWKNGSTSKSVLFDGCRLARQLQSLEWPNQEKEKWEMIDQVWVELLTYAASHSEWREHSRELTKGGEFLTHVCLLMAYFGLSEQYYHDGQAMEQASITILTR